MALESSKRPIFKSVVRQSLTVIKDIGSSVRHDNVLSCDLCVLIQHPPLLNSFASGCCLVAMILIQMHFSSSADS